MSNSGIRTHHTFNTFTYKHKHTRAISYLFGKIVVCVLWDGKSLLAKEERPRRRGEARRISVSSIFLFSYNTINSNSIIPQSTEKKNWLQGGIFISVSNLGPPNSHLQHRQFVSHSKKGKPQCLWKQILLCIVVAFFFALQNQTTTVFKK